MTAAFDFLANIFKDVISFIEGIAKLLEGALGSVLQAIEHVVDTILTPIRNGLSYAIDAVAPIKWLLELTKCIMKLF